MSQPIRFVPDRGIAVGDLAFEPLGKRFPVWVMAEHSVVKAAAYEFADVEKMVESKPKSNSGPIAGAGT